MSAIAGRLRFDGGPVREAELVRAANALTQYGPDRSDVAVAGPFGLVHVLARFTPEDRFDRQPCRGDSGALIVADLRLDNRGDLIALLGMTPAEAASWSDSRLLLALWETLGDCVWPLLRGPFAVAIAEPRERSLTLARDHLGLRTVMWHRGAHAFSFATMPNGLFAFVDVPRQLSEEKFADFLVLNHADHATTIYRNVFRVPPAHVMRVTAGGAITQRRYWSAGEIMPFTLSSDQDYADGLRDCLDRAVRRQLRSVSPVGCLLSGGLDSSAVAALAARALAEKNQRLAGFTGVPRPEFRGAAPAGSYANETPFVDAIARKLGNLDPHYISAAGGDSFAALDRFFVALDGPVRNPANLGFILEILQAARAQGCQVLLSGFAGNSTVSWSGWSQAATHLLAGRLLTAYRQWRLYYTRSPYSAAEALRQLFLAPLIPPFAARRAAAPWHAHAPIRPDFAAAAAVKERARRVGHDFHYRLRRDDRVAGLADVDYAGEWRAAEAAVTGVDVRDPTADVDVVHYCLGVPPQQFLAEGIDRSLIRRAMWGLLPEKVLTNRAVGLQALDWADTMKAQRITYAREVAALDRSPLARRIIDIPRLQRAISNWPGDDWQKPEIFTEYNLALSRGVAGGRFLRWFEGAN